MNEYLYEIIEKDYNNVLTNLSVFIVVAHLK